MSVFSMAGSNPALPTYPLQRSVRLRSSASAYLTRTPTVAGNRQKFTWSGWIKRGNFGAAITLFEGFISGGFNGTYIWFRSDDTLQFYDLVSSIQMDLTTSAVFRDPAAWYHIVVSCDTTQATAANRAAIYVNGVQQTLATATYPSQNYQFGINNTTAQYIGANNTANTGLRSYYDGEMTEINFVDGQALTPSSFGAYNSYGVWSPAKYTGSYGTNGFYLNFQDNSALTTTANVGIGKDSSGNGNYWTSNNISITAGATYDSMLDVPTLSSATNANFPTLNVIAGLGNGTYSDGNLGYLNGVGATWKSGVGSMGATSGKYYFEYTVTAVSSSSNFYLGVAGSTYTGFASYLGRTSDSWAFQWNGASSVKTNNDVSTTVSTAGSISVGNVIQVAIDLGTGSIWWGRNNTWVQGDPSAGTGASYTNLTGTILPGFAVYSNGGDKIAANFGQRPFTYTPPTGFVSLNTYNLPDSIVPVGAQYMAATTYTGTGAARSIANTVNGASFQPDFVWIKDRSVLSAHALTNAVTGITKYLESNTTAAETTDTTSVTALSSTGFNLGVGTATYYTNRNGESFVAWQWKASNASAVTNTSGTGTSSVSANQTAGFSVVTMTGIPTSAGTNTYGHGLGAAPRLIIFKNINIVDSWYVYHASLGNAAYVRLDLSAAQITSAAIWGNTSPTSSVFTLRNNALNTTTGQIILAYCFAEVPGYSKISSYTANGSADGPFVYCGFRPRFILVKDASSGGGNWDILDTSRSPYNLSTARLMANQNAAEDTGLSVDVLSNGFKVRIASSDWGVTNGNTVIFAAFAENPFKNALAR